jgi:hypothetical protein
MHTGRPTPKKIFEIKNVGGKDKIVWHYDEKPKPKGLDLIFEKYFKHHNCTGIFNTINRYATFDGVLTSGGTHVVVEYKGLTGSVAQYNQVLLEKNKYISLKSAAKQLGNAPILYVCEFDEAILIYQLISNLNYNECLIDAQADNRGAGDVCKYVYFLPYKDANLIIGKGTHATEFGKIGVYRKSDYHSLNKFIEITLNK